MVRRQIFKALESAVNEGLRALLYFGERDSARAIFVNSFAQQTVTDALCCQSTFAGFIKTDFVRSRRSDLNHVFLQGSEARRFCQ